MLIKRAKGLCFCCDGKFSLGHWCKDRALQVLTMCNDEKNEGEGEIPKETLEEEHLDLVIVELSLNTVMGLMSNRTMKVKGQITLRDEI